MRLATVYFVMLLIFISCQENKKEHSTSEKEMASAEKAIEHKFNAFCFFKLDDKYSSEKDSIVIAAWLKEKSLLILKNDTVPNIFDQNGGGPNGSQWNPGTDLYIAILTHSSDSGESLKLNINGKPYKEPVYTYRPNLIWHVVKEDFWERQLKAIDSLDVEKIHPIKFTSEADKKEFYQSQYGYPGIYGDILKFEVSNTAKTLTKFFQAAYGE